MSLRHALLVTLLDGEASGYELAKRFDVRVASFWHAQAPQLYAELGRMEKDELVDGRRVLQERRPNKRVFSLTEQGRSALVRWLHEPSRLNATKDELLVRMAAVDHMEPAAALAAIDERRAQASAQLASYDGMAALLLRGRTEEEFLQTARRIGPYLSLRRGIAYETSRIEWCDWASTAISTRTQDRTPTTAKRPARRRKARSGQSAPA